MSRSILRLATGILVGFFLASCTFNQGKALTAADAARLKGARLLVVTTGDLPLICPVVSFGEAMGQATMMMASAAVISGTTGTSPGAAGGLVAGNAAHTPGVHGGRYAVIPNVANRVAAELAGQLVRQHGASKMAGTHILSGFPSGRQLARERPDADFALVVTANCGASCQVHNPTRYNIHGAIQSYLIDLKSRKTLAVGILTKTPGARSPGGKGNTFKSSDLLSPGSKTFENWMNDLVAEAMPQFKSKLAGQ